MCLFLSIKHTCVCVYVFIQPFRYMQEATQSQFF